MTPSYSQLALRKETSEVYKIGRNSGIPYPSASAKYAVNGSEKMRYIYSYIYTLLRHFVYEIVHIHVDIIMIVQGYTVTYDDGVKMTLGQMRSDTSVTWEKFVKNQSTVGKEKQAWAENVAVYAAAEALNLKITLHTLDGEPDTFQPKKKLTEDPMEINVVLLYVWQHYICAIPKDSY